MNRVISATWFHCQTDVIGIVICEDTISKERRAYIGAGGGVSEAADIKRILNWGSKVRPEMLENLLTQLTAKGERT